jgi:hypothetical protein
MSTQTKVQNPKIKLLSINVGKATLAQLESLKFLEMSKVNYLRICKTFQHLYDGSSQLTARHIPIFHQALGR